MLKKFKKYIYMLILSTIALSGCTKESPKEIQENKIKKGELKIEVNSEDLSLLETAIKEYNSQNTEVKITLNNENSNEDSQEDFDVKIIKDENIMEYIEENKDNLYKFKDDDIDDINFANKATKNLYKIDDARYGIPLYKKPIIMAFNKEKLQILGISYESIKTYEDYLNVIDNIGDDSKLLGMKNEDDFFKILLSEKNMVIKNHGDADEFRDSLLQITDILKTLKVSESVITYEREEDLIRDFAEGKILSILVTPSIMDKLSKEYKEKKDSIGFDKVPSYNIGGNRSITCFGSSIVINKDSESKSLAIDFVNYLLGDYKISKILFDEYNIIPLNNYGKISKDFEKSSENLQENIFNKLINLSYEATPYNLPKEYSMFYPKVKEMIEKSINEGEDLTAAIEKFQIELWNLGEKNKEEENN